MPTIFKHIDDNSLYEQLVSRIYHIERAFVVRRHVKLHYAKTMPSEVTTQYAKVHTKYSEVFSTLEETSLWFMTVELWSRFLYPKTRKGLFTLVAETNNDDIKKRHDQFQEQHKAVIDYIKTQRNKYLAHADEVEWVQFPNVWDKEYEALISDIKDLLTEVSTATGSQRIPSSSKNVEHDICNVFDDLLSVLSPGLNVDQLSKDYASGVKSFLQD